MAVCVASHATLPSATNTDNCGHHFCGGCMERWMGNTPQGECPVCREPVNKLVPVRILDQVHSSGTCAAVVDRKQRGLFASLP